MKPIKIPKAYAIRTLHPCGRTPLNARKEINGPKADPNNPTMT